MDRHIKDVLQNFVRKKEIEDGYLTQKIAKFWNERMGATITKRTSKIDFKKNRLSIYLDSAPLKQELFMNKGKIKDIINEHLEFPHVQEVVFR